MSESVMCTCRSSEPIVQLISLGVQLLSPSAPQPVSGIVQRLKWRMRDQRHRLSWHRLASTQSEGKRWRSSV